MRQYGQAAECAAKYLQAHVDASPVEAWNRAVEKVTKSEASRKKGCPRATFLALCEVANDVPPGTYTKSLENSAFARRALETLHKNPELAEEPEVLWQNISGSKKSNSQPDVVLALFKMHFVR